MYMEFITIFLSILVPPVVVDLNVTNDTETDTTIEVYVEWKEYNGFNVVSWYLSFVVISLSCQRNSLF